MPQRKVLWLCAVLIAGFVISSPAGGCPCYLEGTCPGDLSLGCVPIPTSLVTVGLKTQDISGWLASGSACGTKSCLMFLRCPCGKKLSVDLCEF